jgi:hypothetical protein
VHAQGTTAILYLDGLSFVSFGNQELYSIPLGSSVAFEFGEPALDGSVPFTIQPAGVKILPIPMGGEYRELRYSLAAPATGTMRETPEGRRLDFTAELRATLVNDKGESGAITYSIPFTTEGALARSHAGDVTLAVDGMRVAEGTEYVQIVGATTNKEEAFPAPGTAVYTLLSGNFAGMP